MLLLWDWKECKILGKINIGITGVPAYMSQKGDQEVEPNFQISFNPHESNYVVVTGYDNYKYYRIEGNEFEPDYIQLHNKEMEITTRYTCHAWMADGKLIVCTDQGEIILCETDGSFLGAIMDEGIEPGFKIECITAFSRGFIIAGNGLIYAFEKSEDPSGPYRMIQGPIDVKLEQRDSF